MVSAVAGDQFAMLARNERRMTKFAPSPRPISSDSTRRTTAA